MLVSWANMLLWATEVVYVILAVRRMRWLALAATGLTLAGWAMLAGGLVSRGLEAGHWPFVGRYEFPVCFAWAIVGVYLLLMLDWREPRLGPFVLVVALGVLGFALTRSSAERAAVHLVPVLRSWWLFLHVASAIAAYGALGVGAGVGLLRLCQKEGASESLRASPLDAAHFPAGAPAGAHTGGKPGSLPPAVDAERMMDRCVTLGFPWLTFSILAGAIWAQNAWGRYWGWDPKEAWSLVVWLWFLLILHLRTLSAWRGRRLALLVLVGFGMVLFSFGGLPWLVRAVRLESLHGF
jgi:cytochrome c-type biogenesis protein CcsB